ncbi:MAG: TonB-dependent receptor [Rhodanobacter sp.]|nr:MAG: TonB-dependent receptor [Rhodanobacter sp.]TAL99669.1 MAG: TonB-dependent receptor [Rhodanobacter sp.]TAM38598.1 MAG: TonB-dependent receptor [Rhodanobacter sp.]TAN23623.1 MAG: TonB-dependent receptor [Rhodanobacter sp.]
MNTKPNRLTFAIVAVLALQPAYAQQNGKADATTSETGNRQLAEDQTAPAQTKAGQPTNLAAITVTATKRVELMQDVPIAVDVVTAQDIESAGLTSAADLPMLVPGITMIPVAGPAASNVVIRGLSTTIGEPNVSFFIDGVYIPSRNALDFMLADNIARIEVAKGPQYALYGRNSFAGAVNFITKAPSNKQEGSISVGLGNYDRRDAKAVASGPFSDGSAYHYRVGVARNDFGGFYRNELTGKKLDKTSARGAFLTLDGAPTDRLNGQVNVIYDGMRRRDFAQQFVSNNGGFVPHFNDNQQYFGDVPSLTNGFAVTPGHFDRDSILASLTVNYDMDWATLTSVTSYNHLKLDYDYDSDYSAAQIATAGTHGPQTSISQDFRLVSPSNEHFDWLLGVYYYHLSDDHVDDSQYMGPAAPLGGLSSDNRERTRSAAVYGTATWHMTPKWDLGLAMRYTRETKSADATTTSLPSAANPAGSIALFGASRTFTPFTPGLYLTYKPSRNSTFYASAVKAIKVGGFNTFTANGAIAPDERSYDSERSTNYELGAKFSLLDGRMLLDMDVYRINWRDQIVRTVGSMGALLNTNAGQTTSKGVEANLQYDANQNWSFKLGGTYNDAKYDEYMFPIVAVLGGNPNLAGVRLQYAPRYTANMSVINRQTLSNGWTWTTRLDGQYRTDMAAIQTGTATIPSAALFNLNTSLDINQLRVSLWVDNIFNNKDAPGAVFTGDPATTFQFATRQRPGLQLFQALVNAPALRTFGVDLRYRF